MLFLIRHAQAGPSDHDDPNDVIRPLDSYGRDQAVWIAERLASENVTRFVSSPALRCLQTIQPAADRFGQTIAVDEALREGSSIAAGIGAVREAGAHAVVCVHGDLLPEIIRAFTTGGMQTTTEPCFAKGVVWRIEIDDDGRPQHATCELAPAVGAAPHPATEQAHGV